ncbi:RDD family protein [Pelomicrobium sp.]|jgi:uncharacterized RDD family membrane protein YckC|uniref:RDD family protein n=1 Tax=Pelomicrobium sp. TaxID=2815319 RepID=UPI002FDD9CB1
MAYAGFGRRFLSLLYEGLLLFAVLLIADLALLLALPAARDPALRPFTQAYLLAVSGVYFVWQWTHGGQTLAMKTWRLQLVSADGAPLSVRQAVLRFLAATLTLLLPSLLWAFLDRERQFLHDRLAGTCIIQERR